MQQCTVWSFHKPLWIKNLRQIHSLLNCCAYENICSFFKIIPSKFPRDSVPNCGKRSKLSFWRPKTYKSNHYKGKARAKDFSVWRNLPEQDASWQKSCGKHSSTEWKSFQVVSETPDLLTLVTCVMMNITKCIRWLWLYKFWGAKSKGWIPAMKVGNRPEALLATPAWLFNMSPIPSIRNDSRYHLIYGIWLYEQKSTHIPFGHPCTSWNVSFLLDSTHLQRNEADKSKIARVIENTSAQERKNVPEMTSN